CVLHCAKRGRIKMVVVIVPVHAIVVAGGGDEQNILPRRFLDLLEKSQVVEATTPRSVYGHYIHTAPLKVDQVLYSPDNLVFRSGGADYFYWYQTNSPIDAHNPLAVSFNSSDDTRNMSAVGVFSSRTPTIVNAIVTMDEIPPMHIVHKPISIVIRF